MSVAHLEKLNDRQRAAVEHGIALTEGQTGRSSSSLAQ